jgi:hypothetical protein
MGDAACRSTTRIIAHTTGTAAHPRTSHRTCGFISAMEAIDPGTTTITRAAACPWTSDRACGFISAAEASVERGTTMMIKP